MSTFVFSPNYQVPSTKVLNASVLRITRFVCVFITAGPITKLFAGGGRRRVEDMCYERRRAEACVDESAHHALENAGGREIV